MAWEPAVAAALAARTGLSTGEAALLWSALPNLDVYESSFLTGPQRAVLGLKAKDAGIARDALKPVTLALRYDVLAAALGDASTDPTALWDPLGSGPDDATSPVAASRRSLIARFGAREAVPDEALASVRSLGRATDSATLVRLLLDPPATPALTEARTFWIADTGRTWDQFNLMWRGGQQDLAGILGDVAFVIPWAVATRPVGDPLRRDLPRLLELTRARLDDPETIVGPLHLELQNPSLQPESGSNPYRGPDGVELVGSTDDGTFISVPYSSTRKTFLRPGSTPSPGAAALLVEAAAARSWVTGNGSANLVAVIERLRSPGFTALAERGTGTPVPAGGFEANPAASASELVVAVARELGCSDDAAGLYLQLLTLLEPTDRSVRAWNGWTPARHKKAVAELSAGGHVIEAKRERAGRTAFVAGGWASAKAPNLPLETWKLPLYDLGLDPEHGRPTGPIGRYLPWRPLHELFSEAWARWTAGDRPGA